MNEIQYVGEHLTPGIIGQALNILAFVAAILGARAFYKATYTAPADHTLGENKEQYWDKIGNWSFIIHGISILSVIGLIFYMMYNQYFEYQYVQAHVSEDLPMQYILVAFWEGQEGSFLLWMFWHVILGFILMKKAGAKWKAPVLFGLCLIQIVLSSMVLGVYLPFFEDFKLGASPMLLLRELMDAPIFAQANYVELITGTGLNPLLQNYWMTIHPPTLFLGFASTSIPFCFALAGLMKKDHVGWLKAVFPWALFSGAILGTGILMGGAWAYEALSFGGYWAWDPVENMSLVPWIVLIAAIHTNAVANATGYSIKSTYLFYMLTFVLVVYSTFLTRSGILGETSVHAFTEMGLEVQLIGFIVVFTLLAAYYLIKEWKHIPSPKKEEAISSKDFWMFIGSLVLIFSAILITVFTSLPVYNKIAEIFNPAHEGLVITEPIPYHNKYQLWIGIFIGILSGFSQYLRFKEVNFSVIRKKILIQVAGSILIACAATYALGLWIDAFAWQYVLLLFAGTYTVIANLDFIIRVAKFNLSFVGSTFSHIGFGLMVIGILASGLNKEYISSNPVLQRGTVNGFDEMDYGKNILLFKGVPTFMNGYEVTYLRDSFEGFTRMFDINYKRLSPTGTIDEEFTLTPNIIYTKDFQKIASPNPATHHYLSKDIFTHISNIPKAEMDRAYAQEVEDSLTYITYEALESSSFTTESGATVEVGKINRNPSHHEYEKENGDLAVGLPLLITPKGKSKAVKAEPILVLRKDFLLSYPVQINELNTKVKLPQAIIEKYFQKEKDLSYHTFDVLKGNAFNYNGFNIRFEDIITSPEDDNYVPEEGDIAIACKLSITDKDQKVRIAKPIFFIRDNSSFSIKDYVPEFGLHLRFESVDPKTSSVKVSVAQSTGKDITLPVEIAEDSLRADYIVLQAILFPGINFFWVGTIMMMLGMLIAIKRRLNKA